MLYTNGYTCYFRLIKCIMIAAAGCMLSTSAVFGIYIVHVDTCLILRKLLQGGGGSINIHGTCT